MYKERELIQNRREYEDKKIWNRAFNAFLNPKNPQYRFIFYVPHYIYIRAGSFCDDVADEIDGRFTHLELAQVLFTDFLEYMKRKNDLHDLHKRLQTRDLSPTSIKHYQTDEAHAGVVFEEFRGFEEIKTRLRHKDALRGECILRDMLEIYPDHQFTLENVLEIVFCDFVDDYRKGVIKNPIKKITQYL